MNHTRASQVSKILFVIAFGFACVLCAEAWCGTTPGAGTPTNAQEGAEHGFPVLRDLAGNKLADGDFVQSLDGGRLYLSTTYQFSSTHRIEEKAVFRQLPDLVQEGWSWREFKDGAICRQFDVDLTTGKATAEKVHNNKLKHWSKELKVLPGKTFGGVGFTMAIKQFRDRLVKGERIQLEAIGFTPTPRLVSVEISCQGLDQMAMSGRILQGDRFIIHPEIPKIASLFVKVPDARIWLINPPPAGFLRWEGLLVEPDDPMVRVDLLPGNQSGPAEPIEKKSAHSEKENGTQRRS